jgi:hypothetical protein
MTTSSDETVDFGLRVGSMKGFVQHKTWSQRTTQIRMPIEVYESIVTDSVMEMLNRDVRFQCRATTTKMVDLRGRNITEKVCAQINWFWSLNQA